MGVPALFRWLNNKYPKITSRVVELPGIERTATYLKGQATGISLPLDGPPLDTSSPNPNGFEIDNLYLDMNGIIHPCCHPEDKDAPLTHEEMFVEIFLYIDRIFGMIRPRRLLYMAIDGVAPRAKMNQQRARRFKASHEAKEKAQAASSLREQLRANGALVPELDTDPEEDTQTTFDTNCITPGTHSVQLYSRHS